MKFYLAALLASFLAPRADTLVFSVAKGAKIGKQLELSLELESQRVSISIDGKELPEEVLKKFEAKTGKAVVEGYGLSEASPVVAINPPSRCKPGSIGPAAPGCSSWAGPPPGRVGLSDSIKH